MAPTPEISVVIGAYRRSEFLPAAVQSVLAQTAPRDAFEVLVVTDRDDPALARALDRSGVAVRTDPEPRIGAWLLAAVRATRAPLVALLDDDDEFEPDRLQAALSVFRAHPEIGLYRNRVSVIDRAGAPVPMARWSPLARDSRHDRRGPIAVAPGDRRGTMALLEDAAEHSFNSSSMIFRRALLDGDGADAFAATRLPDLALVVLAALSPYALYLDDRRRTHYREAAGSATTRVPWLGIAAESHARLGAYAARRGFPELATWLTDRSVHFDRMFRGESLVERVRAASSRRDVADGAVEYLRFLGRHPREWSAALNVWSAPLYAGGYLLLPGITRRMAITRPTAGRG